MSEMVERVAEALARLPIRDSSNIGGELDQLRLREAARAAIEALRDFDFSKSSLWEFETAYADGFGGFRPPWRDLLDAALTPAPPEQ